MGRIIENQILLSFNRSPEQILHNLRPGGGQEGLLYGYLGLNERLEDVIEADRRTLERLQLTYEQLAKTIEDVFLHMPRSINGHRLMLFEYIHSPVCPWGDFCAVSPFDLGFKITEIWLCPSRHFWKIRLFLWFLRNHEKRLRKIPDLVAKDYLMLLSDLHPTCSATITFAKATVRPTALILKDSCDTWEEEIFSPTMHNSQIAVKAIFSSHEIKN